MTVEQEDIDELRAFADMTESFAKRWYGEGNPALDVARRRVKAMRAGLALLERKQAFENDAIEVDFFDDDWIELPEPFVPAKPPIPEGVYYHASATPEFCEIGTHRPMGEEFMQTWGDRWAEFPVRTRPYTMFELVEALSAAKKDDPE